MENSYKKKSRVIKLQAAVLIVLVSFSIKGYSQCTWSTLLSDGFEYSNTTPCPDFFQNLSYDYHVSTGATGCYPATFAHHSGSQAVYVNFVDSNSVSPLGVHAGTLFYSKTITVCPNVQYKISSWFCTTFAGIQCNLKIVVKDGSGVILNSVNSFPCAYAPTFSQYTSGVLTPTTSTMILELTTNVGGGGGNDLGMDDLLIEQCLTNVSSAASQTTLCNTSPVLDLYNLLTPVQPNYGSWAGPSTLAGGYLGTYDPSVDLQGQYIYSYYYQNNTNCPLIKDTANVLVITTPTLSVNSGTICSGVQSVTLTASGAVPSTATYSWSPSTGLSSITGASVFANPLSTTVYTVISSNGACIGQTTATVSVGSMPVLSVNSATICSGNSVTLTTSGATTYSWSPPTGLSGVSGSTVVASPSVTTDYTITGSISGCSSTLVSNVSVSSSGAASISASSLSVSVLGQPIILTASGGNTFQWLHPNGSSSMVTVSPLQNTEYCVEVRENNLCPDTACITIYADFKSEMQFPNVFTPNGDGINDSFHLSPVNIIEYKLLIFNRWGLKVFESSDVLSVWDGTTNGAKANDGVYSYIINAKGVDEVIYEKAGHVTLFR